MGCAEEWDKFEEDMKDYIKTIAHLERLAHECFVHKDESACADWRGFLDEVHITADALKSSITGLSRCLQRR